MTEEDRRDDGFLVTYEVGVEIDIDASGCRVDHVGTPACCTCCGKELHLSASTATLVEHASGHEAGLGVEQITAAPAAEKQLRAGPRKAGPPGLRP